MTKGTFAMRTILHALTMNSNPAFIAAHIQSLLISAYDPGKNCWKLAADGKTVEMKDGNPIWIDANSGETTLSGDTIARLNGEARDLRVRAETAESNMKAFAGMNPEEAK